ncbi:MAG: hypothetical protein DDT34_00782 [Firmicutes bacterium]|nr:hypothetical protein [Bacillota bacterium]
MPEGNWFGELSRILFSIAVVFALLFGLRYLLLRSNGKRRPQNKSLLFVREQLHLGPRSRILLLEVAGRAYLVAMSDQAVSMKEVPNLTALPVLTDEESAPIPFAKELHDMIKFLRQGGKV